MPLAPDDLRIAEPCNEPWEGMAPRAAGRHCDKCDKVVLDLSGLTAEEAEARVRPSWEAGRTVCVRYGVDAEGAPDFAPPRRRLPVVPALVMALPLLAACATPPDVHGAGGSDPAGHGCDLAAAPPTTAAPTLSEAWTIREAKPLESGAVDEPLGVRPDRVRNPTPPVDDPPATPPPVVRPPRPPVMGAAPPPMRLGEVAPPKMGRIARPQ